MSINVLATLPADIGKVICCDHNGMVIVEDQPCDVCGSLAAKFVTQGETDSCGFEVLFECATCFKTTEDQVIAYENADDVEDRAPAADHVFMVCECTNYDGHGDWMRSFTSFRSASAFLRRIEDKAAAWGGLYPNKGVVEVPAAEYAKRAAKERERISRELADAVGFYE